MEDIDKGIVEALMADGRISFTDLAEKVGLSVSATHQRVRRLEQKGIIRGYGAQVDYKQLGLPLTAFIAIRSVDGTGADEIPGRLEELAGVESCFSVAGADNYLAQVRVPSPGDLEDLIREIRSVVTVVTRTIVVLSTPFEDRPVHAHLEREGSPTSRR